MLKSFMYCNQVLEERNKIIPLTIQLIITIATNELITDARTAQFYTMLNFRH